MVLPSLVSALEGSPRLDRGMNTINVRWKFKITASRTLVAVSDLSLETKG